ncbi:MAG: hypothetical protein R3D51_11265 [Hyphomicrobiaceae bacterium]
MAKKPKIVNRRNVDLSPFASAKRKLEADPKAWVETTYLHASIKANAREPIPRIVLDHLSERLNGKAKRRQGRGRTSAKNSSSECASDLSPFASAQRNLEADPKAWIETSYLVVEIKRNAREPIPQIVLAHLSDRLDGKAKKRQGRGRITPGRQFTKMFIATSFDRRESWLAWRQAACGLEGWRRIRRAEWWQGPPSERAARMVQARLKLNIGWERVRNIAYEVRKASQKKA